MPSSVVATLLSSLLSTDLVSTIFRQVFPTGTSTTVPIDPITVQETAFSATLCPGGCGARVTVRNLDVSVMRSDSFPITARITLDVSVASVVRGSRAPFPITSTGGDLTVDVDTARGSTDLKFKTQIVFGSTFVPQAHFRVNPLLLPDALRSFGVNVDIAEIIPVPGFELESQDLVFRGASTGGNVAASVISAYQADFVPYMRQMVRYVLNLLLCQRFGTRCPERPMPVFPGMNLIPNPAIIAAGVAVLFVGGALLWRHHQNKKMGLGTIPPPPPSSVPDLEDWVLRTFTPGTPVVSKEDFIGYCGDEEHEFPAGTKCVVTRVVGGGKWSDQIVHFRCNRVIEGLVTSETVSCDSSEFGWMMNERFRPLVDNWGPLVVPSKKSYKAGWTPKALRYKGRP